MRIVVRAHTASVPPEIQDLVMPLLEKTVRRFRSDGPLGHDHHREVIQHYSFNDDGRLVFSAGLVPRIKRQLEDAGFTVEVDDQTTWGHLCDADRHVLNDPELTTADGRLVTALISEPRGQVFVECPADVGRSIALLARCFNHFSIFVVARNRTERDRLVAQIAEHTDRAVTSNPREAFGQRPRLLVSTLQLAQYAGGDDFQIIVAADRQSALSTASDSLRERWSDATWYAFINGQQSLHAEERLHVEKVFGPIIFQPDKRTTHFDVNVVLIEMQRNTECGKQSGLTRKRHRYWHDSDWNNTVATTARRLAAGDIPDGIPANTLIWHDPRVAIIVESTEHGRAIKRLMPGWKLQTIHDEVSCIPAVTSHEIATFTYAHTYGISADVVVRADGGLGWPLGDALAARTIESADRVLLIDFLDFRDEQGKRDTGSRQSAYKRLGWSVVDCREPVTVPLVERRHNQRIRIPGHS